jgi:signal transduction histidine kinase
VSISITGDVDTLDDELRTCVYRVVQEALTNAERHAHAKSIHVTIQRNADNVTGIIQDDGVGFDRAALREHGLGLLGIEERVRELSGKAEIISQPTGGTRIVIQLPVLERVHELSGVGRG